MTDQSAHKKEVSIFVSASAHAPELESKKKSSEYNIQNMNHFRC